MNTKINNCSMNSTSWSMGLSKDLEPFYLAIAFIILILCVPINCCVLRLIVRGGLETITREFFHLNLAISDILLFMYSVCVFIYFYLHNQSVTVERAIAGICGFSYTARPLFQCCISVERYLAVVHPIIFLRYKPLRYKVYCSAVAWLVALGCCIGYAFITVLATYTSCVMVFFIIIFLVMLFSLLSVLWALKRPEPGDGRIQREEGYNVKMRAFKIIVICSVFTVISYLPVIIGMLLRNSLSPFDYELGLIVTFLTTILLGLFNQLIYLKRKLFVPLD